MSSQIYCTAVDSSSEEEELDVELGKPTKIPAVLQDDGK